MGYRRFLVYLEVLNRHRLAHFEEGRRNRQQLVPFRGRGNGLAHCHLELRLLCRAGLPLDRLQVRRVQRWISNHAFHFLAAP